MRFTVALVSYRESRRQLKVGILQRPVPACYLYACATLCVSPVTFRVVRFVVPHGVVQRAKVIV